MNHRSPRYLPAPPPLVAVGQRLHCILYGGRDGTVAAIHGEQQPATCGSLGGGVMITGGNAYFDIVWDDGTRSPRIPEALARDSVQWAFLDEPLATADEIRQRQAEADAETARRAEAERQRQADYAARKAQLQAEWGGKLLGPDATRGGKRLSSHARGAENLRRQLTATFPGVKFRCRSESYSGGDSIDVTWTDGPTVEQVRKFSDRYAEGRFDGMADIYEDDRDNPWPELFGGAKYVGASRGYRAALELAVARLYARNHADFKDHGDTDEEMERRIHNGAEWVSPADGARRILAHHTIPLGATVAGLEYVRHDDPQRDQYPGWTYTGTQPWRVLWSLPATPAARTPSLPEAVLRHHVTGAIERGEGVAIVGVPAAPPTKPAGFTPVVIRW